ncbi:MAG: hypothetical protein DDG59_01820 [Anaerolineae bacterium]|nr:MAG: hypothetical protein DDG59_01820 [Anaerolineae bacterium]
MHQIFSERGIHTPNTQVIPLSEVTTKMTTDYPVLVKEEHSCSSMGLHLLSKAEDFENLLSDQEFRKKNQKVVIQALLNIRKDLRVILVGNEIIWHYWRINPSESWRPTATGYGSRVDFNNFPEKWRQWILEQFSRLGLTTGAFDIAWENDDLESEPYILEVSPVYQPNPKPKFEKNLQNYGKWKKSITLSDNYHQAYIDLEFQIQSKLTDELVRKWENTAIRK